MSIILLQLYLTQTLALASDLDINATFDIDAAAELTGFVKKGEVGIALRQLEVNANLGLGAIGGKIGLDLMGPNDGHELTWTPLKTEIVPEWAVVSIQLPKTLQIHGGYQPSPHLLEEVDGWNNSLSVYTLGFRETWPGIFLGGRAVWRLSKSDLWRVQAWGGVSTDGWTAMDPIVGFAVERGDESSLLVKGVCQVWPTVEEAQVGISAELPAADWLDVGAQVWALVQEDSSFSFAIAAEFIPEADLSPVTRIETRFDRDVDWALDSGVVWKALPFLKLTGAMRLESNFDMDGLGVYGSISLLETAS